MVRKNSRGATAAAIWKTIFREWRTTFGHNLDQLLSWGRQCPVPLSTEQHRLNVPQQRIIGRQTNGLLETFGFQILVEFRLGKRAPPAAAILESQTFAADHAGQRVRAPGRTLVVVAVLELVAWRRALFVEEATRERVLPIGLQHIAAAVRSQSRLCPAAR